MADGDNDYTRRLALQYDGALEYARARAGIQLPESITTGRARAAREGEEREFRRALAMACGDEYLEVHLQRETASMSAASREARRVLAACVEVIAESGRLGRPLTPEEVSQIDRDTPTPGLFR